jgi:hypothetical protein
VLEFDGLNAWRNSEMPSFSQADKPVILGTKFKIRTAESYMAKLI